MAVNLTDTWKQHAFPDDAPGREERWSLESERRRIHDRTDFDLEQSGSTNKLRRFTSGQNDELNGRTAEEKADDDMMMLLAVGSPAYMEAYNNKLTFQIDGEDFEITQGELHERAKKRAEDLQRQIDDAKRRGASDDEIARMQATHRQVVIVRDNTDPARSIMDEDRHRRVQAALNHPDQDPALTKPVGHESSFGRDPGNEKTSAADMSARFDRDAETWSVKTGWSQSENRTSFAGTIDGTASNNATTSLAAQFAPAVENVPPVDNPGEDQTPSSQPHRTTGLDL